MGCVDGVVLDSADTGRVDVAGAASCRRAAPDRRARRSARRRCRRRRSGRPRQARGLRRASGEAVDARSGRTRRPANCRRSTRSRDVSPSACRCSREWRSPTATSASATASPTRRRGRIAAVLDWELCTLGDPLADVGYLGVYWADPGTASRPSQRSDAASRGSRPTPNWSSATPRGPDATVARSTTTSPSVVAPGRDLRGRVRPLSARRHGRSAGIGDEQLNAFKIGTEVLAESALEAMRRVAMT